MTAEPATVKLHVPIEFGKETIQELTFRRGRLGDVKGINIEAVTVDGILVVASRMTGQPIAALEKLDEDDASEVVEIVTRFLRKCLATGGSA